MLEIVTMVEEQSCVIFKWFDDIDLLAWHD